MNHIDGHPSSTYWECFACDTAEKFHSAEAFEAHVTEHQVVSPIHIPTIIDRCVKKAPQITTCPLCTWAEDREGNLDARALLNHVAEHVHSFSLLSLSWAKTVEGEAKTVEGKPSFDLSVYKKVDDWLDSMC